jgi:hypothetical protein
MASKRFREVRDAIGIDPERIVASAVQAALGEAQPSGQKHHPGRVLAAGAALAAAAAVGQKRMPRIAKVPLRMGLHKLGHKLGDMTRVDELADALRDRLTGYDDEPLDGYDDELDELGDEDFDDEDFDEDEEFDDDEDVEDDDEPRAEDEPDDEEDFDDEDDDGFDDEPEDDDGPRGDGEQAEDEELDDEELDDEPEADLEGEPDDDEEEQDAEPEAAEGDEDREPDQDEDQIAARSVDLGVPRDSAGSGRRDRAPDLFSALGARRRRPPVMRRGSLRVDPAARPPEPDASRSRDQRRAKPKSKAARA